MLLSVILDYQTGFYMQGYILYWKKHVYNAMFSVSFYNFFNNIYLLSNYSLNAMRNCFATMQNYKTKKSVILNTTELKWTPFSPSLQGDFSLVSLTCTACPCYSTYTFTHSLSFFNIIHIYT